MGRLERIASTIAAILAREGLDYPQSKAVFKAARQKAGLTPPPDRRGGIDRLTLEEELRFIDQAYAKGGRTGLMLELLSSLVYGPASGGILDLAFAIDEAHAADDLGEPIRPVETAPALLRALAQPEHHRQRRAA